MKLKKDEYISIILSNPEESIKLALCYIVAYKIINILEEKGFELS